MHPSGLSTKEKEEMQRYLDAEFVRDLEAAEAALTSQESGFAIPLFNEDGTVNLEVGNLLEHGKKK